METNAYALAKKQFAEWGNRYAQKYGIQFIDLILECFYGSCAPKDQFISWVIDKLEKNEPLDLTDGTQKRDFIYVDDALRVYEKVLQAKFEKSYVEVPVGTGEAPAIHEVVQYLKAIIGSTSELRFGIVQSRKYEYNSFCDTTKLEVLGALPSMNWRDGMRTLISSKGGYNG